METSFTPLTAIVGGGLIGSAVLVLFLSLGRIAGVSGMIGGVLRRSTTSSERAWRVAFLAGLVLGPVAAMLALDRPLIQPATAGPGVLLAAGLLVGLGAGMSNGCTSGHVVCGVSRLSIRSIAATVVFMAFGFITASVGRHIVLG